MLPSSKRKTPTLHSSRPKGGEWRKNRADALNNEKQKEKENEGENYFVLPGCNFHQLNSLVTFCFFRGLPNRLVSYVGFKLKKITKPNEKQVSQHPEPTPNATFLISIKATLNYIPVVKTSSPPGQRQQSN
ncbi:MAG: hypothetical protein P8K79_01090 [Mariniblastus sp.]|nr:hypothetical protein [Mariniblastus sp.]